jgi:tetratricopeptide (TPR) repeat protein
MRLRLIAALPLAALLACGAQQTDSSSAAFLAGTEDQHFNAAVELRQAGNLDGAEREFRAAITANPRYLAAHVALGNLLSQRERWTEARDAYAEALGLRESSIDAQLGMARAKIALGDGVGATDNAGRAVDLARGLGSTELLGETLLVMGQALMAAGMYEEAAAAFDEALEQDSTNTNARIELARLYAVTLRITDAIRVLNRAESYEDDPVVLLAIGQLYYDLRIFDRAIEALNRARELGDEGDDVLYLLAASYMGSDQRDMGMQFATQVIERNPYYLDAYAVRGAGELRRGYADRARADALRVLADEPDDYDALLLLGDVELDAGNTARAEEHYRQAEAAAPGHIPAAEHLADLYSATQRWTDYVAIVEPLIDRPDIPTRWPAQLADAHLASGNPAAAVRYRSRIAQAAPSDVELNAGVARLALDNPGSLESETIREHARIAFERSGGGTLEIRLLYVDALLNNGEVDDAARVLEVAIEAWPRNPDVVQRREAIEDAR